MQGILRGGAGSVKEGIDILRSGVREVMEYMRYFKGWGRDSVEVHGSFLSGGAGIGKEYMDLLRDFLKS